MCKIHTLTLVVSLAFGGIFLPLEASADEPPGTAIEQDRNANMRSRRARRRQRRQERRARWAEYERERQATERERLRAQQAQAAADQAAAEAEAERLRRQPVPVIVAHQPVQVQQFAFNVNQYRNTVEIQTGFEPDPYMMRGHAAGRIPSRRLGLPDACPGFWTNQPQHVVSLPYGMRYFRVDTISRQDTTLAIVTPDGQVWCDDDSAGNYNARLEGQFPAGTYAVYVGTYQRGRRANYRIALTEIPAQAQVAQAPVPQQQTVTVTTTGPQYQQVQYQQPVQQAPSCRSELLNAGHHASNLQYCRATPSPTARRALLQQGHHPTNLQYLPAGVAHRRAPPRYCSRGIIRRTCSTARASIRSVPCSCCSEGSHPTQLMHCR